MFAADLKQNEVLLIKQPYINLLIMTQITSLVISKTSKYKLLEVTSSCAFLDVLATTKFI